MTITTRPATPDDAEGMNDVLTPILERWQSTRPRGAEHIRAFYIEHGENIACTVACDGARIVGFQVLKRAWDGNPYDLPVGWGIIGTYVDGGAAGKGVGRALFAASHAAAEQAGIAHIDASIGADNPEGLAYYGAMGFVPYAEQPGLVQKRFDLVKNTPAGA